jgi:hypothetical protein
MVRLAGRRNPLDYVPVVGQATVHADHDTLTDCEELFAAFTASQLDAAIGRLKHSVKQLVESRPAEIVECSTRQMKCRTPPTPESDHTRLCARHDVSTLASPCTNFLSDVAGLVVPSRLRAFLLNSRIRPSPDSN